MKESFIEITKTARYYTLGNLNNQTKEVWFVLHGYAQLAKKFISLFQDIVNPHNHSNYLNKPYNQLQIHQYNGIKVNIWAFSQGASTATRWIENSNIPFNKLVIASGEIAKEFQQKLPFKLQSLKTIFLYGNKDPFITPDKVKDLINIYISGNLKIMEFDGAHEVQKETIPITFSY